EAVDHVLVAVEIEVPAVVTAGRGPADGRRHDVHREAVRLAVRPAVGGLAGPVAALPAAEAARGGVRWEARLEVGDVDARERPVDRAGVLGAPVAAARRDLRTRQLLHVTGGRRVVVRV